MPLRDLIFANLRRKIFALLVAILLWLLIHLAGKPSHKTEISPPPPATNSLVTP